MLKLPHARATFGRCDVEKVHAVVAQSTFQSKKFQNPVFGPLFDDPMPIRCRKSAHRCGAKHISKCKVSKTEGFGTLFDDSNYTVHDPQTAVVKTAIECLQNMLGVVAACGFSHLKSEN